MNKFILWLSLLFAGLVIYNPLQAQGENDYLPFFNGHAIRWNGNSFIPDTCVNKNILTTSTWAFEGSTAYSDKTGALKLYTDGFSLYNDKHKVIDSGFLACFGLNSFCTSVQGCLILPTENAFFFFQPRLIIGEYQKLLFLHILKLTQI